MKEQRDAELERATKLEEHVDELETKLKTQLAKVHTLFKRCCVQHLQIGDLENECEALQHSSEETSDVILSLRKQLASLEEANDELETKLASAADNVRKCAKFQFFSMVLFVD